MSSPISFESCCVTEAIRQKEQHWGPVEDAAEVRRSITMGGDFAQRLVQRAHLLAQQSGLHHSYQQLLSGAKWALFMLIVFAIVVGVTVVYGLLGQQQINVLSALAALLLLNVVSFVVWLVGMGLWHRPSTAVAGNAVARLYRFMVRRVVKGPDIALLSNAAITVGNRGGVNQWVVGALSHLFWLVMTVAALLTLLWALSVQRYGFNWETTLLRPDHFVLIVQSLGTVPAWLGFSVPDPALIRLSDGLQQLSLSQQRVWSSWLVGCVVCYGAVPRVLALLLCVGMGYKRLRALSIDTSLPGVVEHRDRLLPTVEHLGIDLAAPDDTVVDVPKRAVLHTDGHTVLVGIELPMDTPWPPLPLPVAWHNAGIVDTREQRAQLLQYLTEQSVAQLVVICAATQTPDRGVVAWLSELRGYAQYCTVVLTYPSDHAPDVSTQHELQQALANWHNRLTAAQFPASQIVVGVDALQPKNG